MHCHISTRGCGRRSVHWSIRRSIHRFVRQSIGPSVGPSVSPSIRPSVCPSVHPSHTSWISEKYAMLVRIEQKSIHDMELPHLRDHTKTSTRADRQNASYVCTIVWVVMASLNVKGIKKKFYSHLIKMYYNIQLIWKKKRNKYITSKPFLNATMHLYKRFFLSICQSVCTFFQWSKQIFFFALSFGMNWTLLPFRHVRCGIGCPKKRYLFTFLA